MRFFDFLSPKKQNSWVALKNQILPWDWNIAHCRPSLNEPFWLCVILINLQRAVNRQPWLPRGWPVETRIAEHDRSHDDLNQHDEVAQHPASQTASTMFELLEMTNITTMSYTTIRVRQLRRCTICFRRSTARWRDSRPDTRKRSSMFDFRALSTWRWRHTALDMWDNLYDAGFA